MQRCLTAKGLKLMVGYNQWKENDVEIVLNARLTGNRKQVSGD